MFQTKNNVTQTVTTAAIKMCQTVIKSETDTLTMEVLEFFKNQEIDTIEEKCSEILKFEISNPFQEFNAKDKQLSYYKRNLGSIDTKEYCLGKKILYQLLERL